MSQAAAAEEEISVATAVAAVFSSPWLTVRYIALCTSKKPQAVATWLSQKRDWSAALDVLDKDRPITFQGSYLLFLF